MSIGVSPSSSPFKAQGGFANTPSSSPSNLPSSSSFVYNLAQTSISSGLVSKSDISYTKSLYGGNLPNIVQQNTGEGFQPIDMGDSVHVDSTAYTDSVPGNDYIAGNLGGYYETAFPYGSYYGSTFVGGDDDYSSVAWFPYENYEAVYDFEYLPNPYDEFFDLERYTIPELMWT